MKQKLLSLFLTAFIPMAMMAYDCEVDGICYNLDESTQTASVTYYSRDINNQKFYTGDITIPQTVSYRKNLYTIDYTVTSISGLAFYQCKSLTSITIPEGVTSIGGSAFYDCNSLTSITIPSTVTSIGESAFEFCALTTITIPEGVASIESRTFYGCRGLTSITIPEGVTSIGENAFQGCTGLPVENNIRYADTYLVEAVDKTLSNYQIKEGTRFIGNGAFKNCTDPTSITIPEGVTSIGNSAFQNCSGLTSITIPEGVTSIGNSAFQNCSGLSSITIPSSVTSIGKYCAFSSLSDLTIINVDEENTVYDSRSNCNAIIESSTNTLIYGCKNSTIPSSVTSIGDNAFISLSGLTSITIPEGVTSIGNSAFSSCSSLTSITIPEGVTSIGNSAFSSCSSLTSITIPSSVTSIGLYAFRDCSGLTSVTIAEGVTSIGNRAFQNCSGLSSITIPSSVTSIGYATFQGCSGLTSVTIADDVTSIGNNAFNNVGTSSSPCVLYVPDGFDFGGVDTSGDHFQWYGGYFKLPTETTITISSAGVGTFCYDKDLDFSSVNGLKAYVAVGYNKNTGNVIVVEVKDVPAGTGLYLKGTPGTYQVPFGSSSSYYTNMLVGTTASTTINATDGSMTNFILYNGTNGIGFYTFNNSYTMGANKAYLQIPTSMVSSSSSANYLGIEFEEGVTGIDNVHSATEQAEWYSLDGRRLNSKPTQKGVYIVNGKKVVVK